MNVVGVVESFILTAKDEEKLIANGEGASNGMTRNIAGGGNQAPGIVIWIVREDDVTGKRFLTPILLLLPTPNDDFAVNFRGDETGADGKSSRRFPVFFEDRRKIEETPIGDATWDGGEEGGGRRRRKGEERKREGEVGLII